MAEIELATLTVRIRLTVQKSLRVAVKQERCSLATMTEVMIRDYWQQKGLGIVAR